MAAVDRQHDALQTIFSVFLGLMVVAVIGIGVYTFYPSPVSPSGPNYDYAVYDSLAQAWRLNTSIVLVILATAIMGVSLFRSDQLKVVSNGLLLGGVFSMLYGLGWTISSDSSYLRFIIVAAALAVTVALGYAKFVWLREPPVPAAAASGASGGAVLPADVSGLAARIAALETKIDAAAAAFGRREGD
jgi:FtsH-binding integral membrane protein